MDVVQTTALLSQYGLYAIVAILAACVVYLYKRIVNLEKELRRTLETHVEIKSRLVSETTDALRESTEALKQSSDALAKMSSIAENFGYLTQMLKELIERMARQ